MGIGKATKRAKRAAQQNARAVRQQAINDSLLSIPGVCYRVHNLWRVV